jgi:hypothetical protein
LQVIKPCYTFVLKLLNLLNMQSLFEEISIKGLTRELLRRVSEEREGISGNTIYLALKDERPAESLTPLRKYIRGLAKELILEQSSNRASADEPAHSW